MLKIHQTRHSRALQPDHACLTHLSRRVGRRVEQPRQEPVRRPVFSSVSLRDLQRHELGEAGLEDPPEGVLIEADRQPLHVALHLAQRVNVCQELKYILNVKYEFLARSLCIKLASPEAVQLSKTL